MKNIKKMLCLLAISAMLLCGCEMPDSMKEDLAYIRENAENIKNAITATFKIIVLNYDEIFGDGESEKDMFLEPLLEKNWTLCAIEDEYGYTDQIFEDEEKRFLLVDEWISLSFSPLEGVGNPSGEVIIRYSCGNADSETHSYQYNRYEDGLWLAYMIPDQEKYGQDADYERWMQTGPSAEDWPFMLPLKGEAWYLKYDETRAMVKIERVRDGEDAPYMSWYLEGKPWFE